MLHWPLTHNTSTADMKPKTQYFTDNERLALQQLSNNPTNKHLQVKARDILTTLVKGVTSKYEIWAVVNGNVRLYQIQAELVTNLYLLLPCIDYRKNSKQILSFLTRCLITKIWLCNQNTNNINKRIYAYQDSIDLKDDDEDSTAPEGIELSDNKYHDTPASLYFFIEQEIFENTQPLDYINYIARIKKELRKELAGDRMQIQLSPNMVSHQKQLKERFNLWTTQN